MIGVELLSRATIHAFAAAGVQTHLCCTAEAQAGHKAWDTHRRAGAESKRNSRRRRMHASARSVGIGSRSKEVGHTLQDSRSRMACHGSWAGHHTAREGSTPHDHSHQGNHQGMPVGQEKGEGQTHQVRISPNFESKLGEGGRQRLTTAASCRCVLMWSCCAQPAEYTAKTRPPVQGHMLPAETEQPEGSSLLSGCC